MYIYLHHVLYVMRKVDWDNSWIVGAKLRSELCVAMLWLSVQSLRIAPCEVNKAWIDDQSMDWPDIQSSDCIQGKCAKCGLKLIHWKLTRNKRVESQCLLKIAPTLIINSALSSGSVDGMTPDKRDFISSVRSLLGHCVPNLHGKGFHPAWAASRWAIFNQCTCKSHLRVYGWALW